LVSSCTILNHRSLPLSRVCIRTYSTKPIPNTPTQPVYSHSEDSLDDASNATTHAVDATTHAVDATTHTVETTTNAVDTATTLSTTATDVAIAHEPVSTFFPVNLMSDTLLWAHHATGLPWWGTIMLTTACVRILVFPVMGYVMKNNLKLAEMKVFTPFPCSFQPSDQW
jgi:membrane protein insertase Oxa1/YidC/SpoIIIJ